MLQKLVKVIGLICEFLSFILTGYFGIWKLQAVPIINLYHEIMNGTYTPFSIIKVILFFFIVAPIVICTIFFTLFLIGNIVYDFGTSLGTKDKIGKDFGIHDEDILEEMTEKFEMTKDTTDNNNVKPLPIPDEDSKEN